MNRDVCEHFVPVDLPCDRCVVPSDCPDSHQPVAWMHTNATGYVYFRKNPQDKVFNPQPLYATPFQRKLTDEVIADLWHQNGGFHHHFARAIERWLKGEK